jgi:preprotein translocase subunit SecG
LNDSSPAPPGYSPLEHIDTAYQSGRRSSDTARSSTRSSVSSFSKLKSGWDWIRTKSGARLGSGYERKRVPDIQPTRVGRGIWKDQLLVDRSIRSMAGLTTLFAIAMIVVVACYIKIFIHRPNRTTSSVGGDSQKCSEVTHTNTALLLLINVAATMILGMSNTYQQLVTSLNTSDLKHMLQKYGDSRYCSHKRAFMLSSRRTR